MLSCVRELRANERYSIPGDARFPLYLLLPHHTTPHTQTNTQECEHANAHAYAHLIDRNQGLGVVALFRPWFPEAFDFMFLHFAL
jgi:hypothetical protein